MSIFMKAPEMHDVCFEVSQISHGDKVVKLKGTWWNVAMGEPFAIINHLGLVTEVIKVPAEKFKTWKLAKDPSELKP